MHPPQSRLSVRLNVRRSVVPGSLDRLAPLKIGEVSSRHLPKTSVGVLRWSISPIFPARGSAVDTIDGASRATHVGGPDLGRHPIQEAPSSRPASDAQASVAETGSEMHRRARRSSDANCDC